MIHSLLILSLAFGPWFTAARASDLSPFIGMLNDGMNQAQQYTQGMNNFATTPQQSVDAQIKACMNAQFGSEMTALLTDAGQKAAQDVIDRAAKKKSNSVTGKDRDGKTTATTDGCEAPSFTVEESPACTNYRIGKKVSEKKVIDEINKYQDYKKEYTEWKTKIASGTCGGDSVQGKVLQAKKNQMICAQKVLDGIMANVSSADCPPGNPSAIGCLYNQAEQMYGSFNNIQSTAQNISNDILTQLNGDKDGPGLVQKAKLIDDYLRATATKDRNPKSYQSAIQTLNKDIKKNEKKLIQDAAKEAWKCANDPTQPFMVYNTKLKKKVRLFCRSAAVDPAKATSASQRSLQVERPCGLLDYLSQGASASASRASGNTRASQADLAAGDRTGSSLMAFVDRLKSETGAGAAAAGPTGADGQASSEVLDSNLQDPNAVEAYINKNMPADIDANVRPLLTAGLKSCFQVGANWKANQKNEGSNYFEAKNALDTRRNDLLAGLKNEVDESRRTFNDAVSAMDLKESTFSTKGQCDMENADSSFDCYKRIRDNIEDIYEGTGSKTWMNRQVGSPTVASNQPVGTDVTGGKQYWKPGMSGYILKCHGLKGCIEELKGHDAQMKKQVALIKTTKAAKAGEANQSIRKVLGQAANQVAAAQAAMKAALDGIRAQAGKMGAKDLPGDPKGLEAMGQKDWPKMSGVGEDEKDNGPFTHPGADMRKVLAGMGSGAWEDGEPAESIGKIDESVASVQEDKDKTTKETAADLKKEAAKIDKAIKVLEGYKTLDGQDCSDEDKGTPAPTVTSADCKVDVKICQGKTKTELEDLFDFLKDYATPVKDANGNITGYTSKDNIDSKDFYTDLDGRVKCGTSNVSASDACKTVDVDKDKLKKDLEDLQKSAIEAK